jgi:hypothetical protein
LFAGGGGGAPDGSTPNGRDAGLDGAVPCVPGKFNFELATAQLMFVIDRSGSMERDLRGGQVAPGQQSRWTLLRDALFQTITPFDGQIAMGAKFYPEPVDDPANGEEACRVDTGTAIAPKRGGAKDILDVFDTTEPRGGTPTAEAVQRAADFLAERRTVARTLVLATDGAPNCNPSLDPRTCVCTSLDTGCTSPNSRYSCLDDTRTVNAIRDISNNRKIPVYVIGIGGLEKPEFGRVLDDMAVAGGRPRAETPRYYSVQTASEMKQALASIASSVAKCTYLTPSAPTDADSISVEVDGKPVGRDPSHTNGWDWVDKAYGTIAFFGAACDAASNGSAVLTGVVTCTNP